MADLFKGVPKVEPVKPVKEKKIGLCDWRGCMVDAEVAVVHTDSWSKRLLCRKHAETAMALASVPTELEER